MARFAIVDSSNGIVGFSGTQIVYNPLKGSTNHPAPWRSLPCPVVTPPAFDPLTQVLVGPTYTVNASDVTEVYSVRQMTAQELSNFQDQEVSGVDLVAFTVLFNHENRIRVLEGKATITKAQFIAGVKALL